MKILRAGARRGFTLVELLVYTGALGLLLSCVYAVLSMSMACFQVSQAAADLQSSAQTSVLKISTDLSESNVGTVTAGSNYILFCSPRSAIDQFEQDTSGNLKWQKWVCYWVDTSGRLWRSEQLINAPPAAPPAATSAPDLNTIKRSSRTRVIASGVDLSNSMPLAFSVANGAVRITANFATTIHTTNRCQITSQIKCRN